jgi:hypothetical protein
MPMLLIKIKGFSMKCLSKVFVCSLVFFLQTGIASADNQTNELSTIMPESGLPFRVVIEEANFHLPVGIQSGVVGEYQGQWIFIAGRMNGLHGFGPDPFPPNLQNTNIYVVNPATGVVKFRSLSDPSSGLTQAQIDTLSVTSPEGYQEGNTLYMAGGYGVDTGTGTFGTKPVLTAINLPGIVQWVTQPENHTYSVASNISQVYHALFQVTGGKMFKLGKVTQLVFGQNFTGVYTPGSNGDYTQQVRQFLIKSVNGQLAVDIYSSKPQNPDPNFRRRDLNIVPAIFTNNNMLQYGLIAFAGVFTVSEGVWTVPVTIDSTGNPTMANPVLPTTFKQGMNQYHCASAGFYSKKHSSFYNIFFGGMSYGFYTGSTFQTDSEIPFINQVTTIQMDKNGRFTQYLMNNTYPTIISTQSNPGNTLLFGAGAYFMPNNILKYPNGVINLDNIRRPTVIGYIVGGIQSTLPNTNSETDSAASPYVFKVTLIPTA